MNSKNKQQNNRRLAIIANECRRQAEWEGEKMSAREALALARDIARELDARREREEANERYIAQMQGLGAIVVRGGGRRRR